QKATTTQAVVENGMRVFTAIYKRLRRALSKEIRRVYSLNRIYFDPQEYLAVVEPENLSEEDIRNIELDYEDADIDVIPTADPNAVSQLDKFVKAQALLQMVQLGAPVRPVLVRYYEALEIENPEEVLPPEQPPPDPELMLKAREQELKEREFQHDQGIEMREQTRKELETFHKIRQGDEKLDIDAAKAAMDSMNKAMSEANKSSIEKDKLNAAKAKDN